MKRFKRNLRVEFQGSSKGVSSVEGLTMPVFTFEKISPPIRSVPSAAPATEKPRSVIIQFLDRFVEARVKRAVIAEDAAQPRPPKPAE
jgi:hypothetical protein